MSENKSLTIVEAGQLATRPSPMDALALMSETEFRQRLDGLKVAQKRMAIIQRELMDEDVDYGVIPGTGGKPTLLKPGAEKLCKFHHLVPTFQHQVILGDGVNTPHLRVLTVCSLHHEAEDGPIVAQGVGAANSWEKKYRWREGQRKCPHCGAAAIIKGKAEFGGGWLCWNKKGGCGSKFDDTDLAITEQQQGQIENPDPFDGENTYVKIAAKRSQTDATLRATATSGLFTQDVEEMVDLAPQPAGQATQQPRQSGQAAPPQAAKAQQSPSQPKTPPSNGSANNVKLMSPGQLADQYRDLCAEAEKLGLTYTPPRPGMKRPDVEQMAVDLERRILGELRIEYGHLVDLAQDMDMDPLPLPSGWGRKDAQLAILALQVAIDDHIKEEREEASDPRIDDAPAQPDTSTDGDFPPLDETLASYRANRATKQS